ncbi:MAG: TIGR04211 family SH3 domain-containing protein [Desulfobacterales bacterium]|nr:MAG: TIGR04211 family SH3 domain-containing protein [Desulfobacterales bacterium]
MPYKLFIIYSLLVNICIIYAAIPVHAKSMYVTDVLKVTLRTGPSIENKIIKMVESGQRVEVVEPGQEWSLIRLFDGKEGWILNRYLIPNETNKLNLERLEAEHSGLKTKFRTIYEENSKLKTDNKMLSLALAATEKSLTQVRNDYESLKASSTEFLTLKSNFEKTSTKLSEQTKRADELEEQVEKLTFSNYIKWFLAGSGVLFVGFILGFSTKRQRRQSSLL